MMPLLEKDILEAVKQALNHIRGVRVWRQNTGQSAAYHKGKKRVIRYGQKGAADLTGLAHGIRLEVEVKVPGNKPTADQRAWGEMIEAHGGIYFWTTDPLEAVKQLTAHPRFLG